MSNLNSKIARLRESVVAILSLTQVTPPKTPISGKPTPASFNVKWGSGFCVVDNKYVVTANHTLLDNGKTRDPKTKFYAFIVPKNGNLAFYYPVNSFTLERKDVDMAILELGTCSDPKQNLPASPVIFSTPSDGSKVLTVGFPSPEVHAISADKNGNYKGGNFLLKSYANEGIVAAQYDLGKLPAIEFNVAWNNGESGGPIATQDDEPAIFSLMQHYRNVQTPHGIQPGPRRGLSLSLLKSDLKSIGATII